MDQESGRTFDWHPPEPERLEGNQPFLLSVKAETILTNKPLRSYAWKRKAWLDQGREGACTGFGAAQALSAGQYAVPVTNGIAQGFYEGAKRYDEWPGENYEGSSVLGAMEFLHHETYYLRAYWWATTLDEVLHAVAFYGPVEMGSWWNEGMMQPDSDGNLHLSGQRVGGHAYCVAAVDLARRRARIDNSWGPHWGQNGSAWIGFEELEALLREQGECALPRKTKRS
jgi:hypothetical protein